jgi:hypothetical protein
MSDLALAAQKLLANKNTMNLKLICDFINLEIKIHTAKSINTAKKELGNLDFFAWWKEKEQAEEECGFQPSRHARKRHSQQSRQQWQWCQN